MNGEKTPGPWRAHSNVAAANRNSSKGISMSSENSAASNVRDTCPTATERQIAAEHNGMYMRDDISAAETPIAPDARASWANSIPQTAARPIASTSTTQLGANHSVENTIATMTTALST